MVRVRRDSDNGERDFRSSEINSGEMVNWVNQQTIKPLDIRELEADGRTGDFLIPKAAYSLRSLGERQATLAATGDTVARADGKFVIQARRTSDDALKSFTADEVADGTLVTWVTTSLSNGVFINNGYETFSGASASGFTASNTTSAGFANSVIPAGIVGKRLQVSFDIVIVSGSPRVALRATTSTGIASSTLDMTTSGSYTATLTATGSYSYVGFSEGDVPSEFTVSNFQIIGQDGFVSKWYDQSVNQAGNVPSGNHAVQATAASQPKIVDAGALVTDGLDFDGSSSEMDIDGLALASLNYGAFALVSIDNPTASSLDTIFDSTDGVDAGFALSYGNTANKLTPFWFDGDDSTANVFSGGSNLTSAKSIYSVIIKSGASTTHINGSSNDILTNTWTTAGTNSFSKSTIGYDQSVSVRNFNGKLAELIIYNTDQTDNRTALEANIGETYSIAGIPAYSNTVNGFVETWYDQSGNGNDATQLTAGSQPKIVSGGSLVAGGLEIDGVDDFLSTSGISITQPISTFSVFTPSAAIGALYGANNHSLFTSSTNLLVMNNGTPLISTNSFSLGTENVVSAISNSALSESYVNGVEWASGNSGTNGISGTLYVGRNTIGRTLDGLITELIIYPSDQSANRPAIETNINSHYDIF